MLPCHYLPVDIDVWPGIRSFLFIVKGLEKILDVLKVEVEPLMKI